MRRALVVLLVMLLAGCSAPPTTRLLTPRPTVRAIPRVTASPSPAPTGLVVVRCAYGDDDPTCQDGLRITNPVKVGEVVTLVVTVRNEGSEASPPLTMMLPGPMLDAEELFAMTDRFPLVGCVPDCRRRVTNDGMTAWATWPGIAPGATVDLTLRLRAAMRGVPQRRLTVYNEFGLGVFGAPFEYVDGCPPSDGGVGCLERQWERTMIAEWPGVQVVTFR